MNFFLTAFFLGLAGNLHCFAMCGPLVVSLQRAGANPVLYHSGRLFSYVFLGFLAGLLGFGFEVSGWMGVVSLIFGFFMLIASVPQFQKIITSRTGDFIFKGFRSFHRSIIPVLKKGRWYSSLALGMVNGFLPCGLIYAGLTGAMASGRISYGVAFMASVGLGTLFFPVAMYVGLAGMKRILAVRWNIILSVIQVLTGILLVLRGLNLGIPFVSPTWANPFDHIGSNPCH